MDSVTAIILAAGKGSRMCSDRAKVLHELNGKPLVHHVLDSCVSADIGDIVVVVGHDRDSVVASLAEYPVRFACQEEQKGTGHAVLMTETMADHDTIVVLCGDAPFVEPQLLRDLVRLHQDRGNACTVVGATLADPTGYGRLVLNEVGEVQRIVEQKDATVLEREITLVNSGTYAFERHQLFAVLKTLQPTNAQGEYYLTDVLSALVSRQAPVGLLLVEDARVVLGINTPEQLASAELLFSL